MSSSTAERLPGWQQQFKPEAWGKKVVILSFDQHAGGVTSGGLTATDVGENESIGGLAREFYDRIGRIRNFSPSAAEALYLKMLEEAGVKVRLRRCLVSVEREGTRIVSAKMDTGETVKAKIFVDATYEGDLLAAAEVAYWERVTCIGRNMTREWSRASIC